MAIPPDPPDQVKGYYANQVLMWANTMKGRPYKWGGNGPNEFDCSGFVHFCFACANVPGSGGYAQRSVRMWNTYNMVNMGDAIPVGQEQPGDLIFPHAGHVGICVGKGQFIDAPTEGVPVGIHKYGTVWKVRRFVVPTTQEASDRLAKTNGAPPDPTGKNPTNGDEGEVIPTTPLDPLGLVTEQLKALYDTFSTVAKVAEWLANKHNWLRIGYFTAGSVALVMGMVTIIGADKVVRSANAVAKVAK